MGGRCTKKRPFKSIEEAKLFAKFKTIERNKKMRYYLCPKCHWYHLTSKNKKNYYKVQGSYLLSSPLSKKDLLEIETILKNFKTAK